MSGKALQATSILLCSLITLPAAAREPGATPVAPPARTSPIDHTASEGEPLPPPPARPRGADGDAWALYPERADPWRDQLPPAVEPRSTWAWYGWQNLLVDGAALALVPFAEDDTAELVLGTYLFGGPIVHWSHGNVGRGFASLGLRVGTPLVLGFALASTCEPGGGEYDCLGALATGVLVGAGTAIVLDSIALAWEKEPVPASLAVGSVQLSPTLSTDGTAGMIASGVF